MFKNAAIIAASIGFATSAAANEQIARALGVEPGAYTLSEMVELLNTGGMERERRFELIHERRAAFEAAVRAAQEKADHDTPEVTRAGQ